MKCDNCAIEITPPTGVWIGKDYAWLCETCYYLEDESSDKELKALQDKYHKELTE